MDSRLTVAHHPKYMGVTGRVHTIYTIIQYESRPTYNVLKMYRNGLLIDITDIAVLVSCTACE